MYVGMSLYNVVLLSITTAVVGYFLRDQHERSYILTSIFILLCVTITLCLVFVPKVLEVAKDPGSRSKPQRAVISNTKVKSAEGQKHDTERSISHMKNLTNQNEMLRSSATKVGMGYMNFNPRSFRPRHSVRPENPEFFGPYTKVKQDFRTER
jgi:gamma-aminobutyric acid type B receptor